MGKVGILNNINDLETLLVVTDYTGDHDDLLQAYFWMKEAAIDVFTGVRDKLERETVSQRSLRPETRRNIIFCGAGSAEKGPRSYFWCIILALGRDSQEKPVLGSGEDGEGNERHDNFA